MNRTTTVAIVIAGLLALLVWGFWPTPLLMEAGLAQRAPLRVVVE